MHLCPHVTPRLLLLGLTLCLPMAFAGCGNTLSDESASVSGDTYWCQRFTLPANARVSVNFTSDRAADCLLMREDQFNSFQSAVNSPSRFIVSYTYMRDFSGQGTTSFAKTATLPSGTWYFVVMNVHNGLSPATGTANFKIKLEGPMAATAGKPSGGGRPSTPEPQAVATPNNPRMINPGNPNTPNYPQQPVIPPPPPLKLSFATLEEAVDLVSRGQPPERHAALSYLAGQAVVAEKRTAIISVLVPALNDSQYAREAFPIVLKWAAKEHSPQLRGALQSVVGSDPSHLDAAAARDAVALAKLLLSFGDDQTVDPLLRLLPVRAAHDGAREALISCGSSIEPAVLDAIAKTADAANSRNAQAMPDYLALLAAIGTEKSIEPIQIAASSKDAATAKAAADALPALATRLKLKPEQYLNNLVNHYTLEAPAGFTVDSTMTQPNTRRWTRTAPNRAVKSSYTIQVLRVDKDYKLDSPPNATPIAVGPLSFVPLPLPAVPQFTQGSHVAALDGQYVIDILAIVDTNDRTAQTSVNDALKKIKAK